MQCVPLEESRELWDAVRPAAAENLRDSQIMSIELSILALGGGDCGL